MSDEQRLNPRQLQQLLVIRARGTILHLAIETENLIEGYIASKFVRSAKKKMELIITVLAQGVGAKEKIDIFGLLIKRYNKSFYNRNKGIVGKLRKINDIRNQFAHWPVSLDPNDIKNHSEGKGFRLIRLKVKKELSDKTEIPDAVYTPAQLSEKVAYISHVNILLADLIRLGGERHTPLSG